MKKNIARIICLLLLLLITHIIYALLCQSVYNNNFDVVHSIENFSMLYIGTTPYASALNWLFIPFLQFLQFIIITIGISCYYM